MDREPPRVHNLIYLLKQIGLKPPERIGKFIVKLNEASVATRYPEEMRELQKNFMRKIVKDVLPGRKGHLGMDKKAALEALVRFRRAIESQDVTVGKMILFGSFAAGTNKEGSDIDVVVLSADFAGKDYWERTDILAAAIYEVFEPIEAVGLTPDEWDKGASGIVEYARHGEIVWVSSTRTPRHAGRLKTVRPKLIRLLKRFESLSERQRGRGEPAYDFSWMWEELGIVRE